MSAGSGSAGHGAGNSVALCALKRGQVTEILERFSVSLAYNLCIRIAVKYGNHRPGRL